MFSKYSVLAGIILLIAAAVFTGCAGTPEPSGPAVSLAMDKTTYISPVSSPGVQDALDIRILYNWGRRTRIQQYEVSIVDVDANTVWTMGKTETEGRSGLELPNFVVWKGTDNNGNPVPDGTYGYYMKLLTYREEVILTDPYTVVVDNTPPEITIETPYTVFSPNDDGNQDLMIFEQTGSEEQLWSGKITGADGTAVMSVRWEDSAPKNFHWNGLREDGSPYPDGEYTYTVSSTDRAGNKTVKRVETIRLSTIETSVTISREHRTFSPNGDGSMDRQVLSLNVSVREEIESWSVTLTDAAGSEVGGFTGSDTPPETLSFPESGSGLEEGTYTARARLVYRNGNTPEDTSNTFTVDLTPPAAAVEANYDIFSPNGDGNKESVTITQSGSKEDTWRGLITGPDGAVVREYIFHGVPEEEIVWQGRNADGDFVPDGVYTYRLTATDPAGNSGSSKTIEFEKDTSEIPELALRPSYRAFSPNGDQVKDAVRFSVELAETEGILSYQFTVSKTDGPTVLTDAAESAPPASFDWNGRTEEGEAAPNGEYTAKLIVRYRNGNVPTVTTDTFTLDREPPKISMQVPYKVFSPNGDGNKDVLPITIESSSEREWILKVYNKSGEAVFTTYWNGEAEDYTWEAVNTNGDRVADGMYSAEVSATDEAGNSASEIIEGIRIDTTPTPISIRAASSGFSPDGNNVQDSIQFNLFIDVQEGIENWNVSIVNSDSGRIVHGFDGEGGNIPDSVIWTGRTKENNERTPEGRYSAELSVRYLKGNNPVVTTETEAVLDVTNPSVQVSISPDRFSPDGDGLDDILTVDLRGEDRSGISSWSVVIRDPRGNRFREFDGKEIPAEPLKWDGTSAAGELVQSAEDYPVEITVTDRYGNTATVVRTITTDVLVERENGTLKIRISSIYFEPNTANFQNIEQENMERNLRTLDRLAEILKRFGDYQITIEGHAAHIFWRESEQKREEQRQTLLPLSKARAEAVKEALAERGITPERMTTTAKGGSEPIVPHGDLENRWKNRRVEFILKKNDG